MAKPASLAGSAFPALAALYSALFAGFGVESPFFPSLLGTRGLSASEIGVVLAAGTAVRIIIGPLAGFTADRHGIRLTLASAALGAGAIMLLYYWATGFWLLMAVSMGHSIAVAPLSPLADALTLKAISYQGRFSYGIIRGLGSAAFICGTTAGGLCVSTWGVDGIIWPSAVCFAMMAPALVRAPRFEKAAENLVPTANKFLVYSPLVWRAFLFAFLLIGSHACNDAFSVIQWSAAGISSKTSGLLWSESVASEILVFLYAGPWLIRRIGLAGSAALASVAGVVRWTVLALTSQVPILIGVQALHGLTFALAQLAVMNVIAAEVPKRWMATTQTLYGTFGLGIASVLFTLIAGFAFSTGGQEAFFMMAMLAFGALVVAAGLPATPPQPAS